MGLGQYVYLYGQYNSLWEYCGSNTASSVFIILVLLMSAAILTFFNSVVLTIV